MSALTASQALSEALALLRCDAPAAYFRVIEELTGLTVALDVEGERFGARTWGADVELRPGWAQTPVADAWLYIDRHTVLDLVDGRIAQLDAVLERRLLLRADVVLMDRLARAARAFADGALRTPRARALLERLRRGWCEPAASG